jgi:drug/metabolite transporter (DMT)-like permease
LKESKVTLAKTSHITKKNKLKTPFNKQQQIGALLAITASFIWSGNFIVSRYAINMAGPISLTFLRWTVATLTMLPFAYKNLKNEFYIFKQNKSYFFLMGMVGFAIYNTLIYTAGHYTTAINMALIGSIIHPIVATVLAAIVVHEKLHWKNISGIVLGILGILLLVSKGDIQNIMHFKFATGDLWMVAAGCCFGTYNVYVKKMPAGISPNSFLLCLFAIGAMLLFPFSIYEMAYVQPIKLSAQFLSIILYIGIGNSTIAYFLWNSAISKLGVGKTALFGTLIPLLSSIEAVFVLNESFTLFQAISGVIILSGIVINTWPSKKMNG